MSVREFDDDHTNAAVLAAIRRAVMPFLDSLPRGDLRLDIISLLTKHGQPVGITPMPLAATLLDAKIEIDARIEDEQIAPWTEDIPNAQWARLTEGLGIRQEELKVVTQQSVGAHTRMDGVSMHVMLRGQCGYGILIGALGNAYRY